jgi:hypothetical protein
MKIFTHINVDLDAVCSVWAVKMFIPSFRNAQVELRPANWNGSDMQLEDIAVDLDAGGRGWKGEHRDGVVYSCFSWIVKHYAGPEDQKALEPLTRFVDIQDAYGSAVQFLLPNTVIPRETQQIFARIGINAVLRALQSFLRNDILVIERMEEILSGFLKIGRNKVESKIEADQIEFFGSDGQVALIINPRNYQSNGRLFELGVKVLIYKDGYNLGVVRSGREMLRVDHPLIREVIKKAQEEHEWFAHPSGFLICRGSRKAPVDSPSNVNPYDLAEALLKLL